MDHKKEILLIEDNREHQIILKKKLLTHLQDIRFTVIRNEKQLRDHLSKKTADLIISDYYLNGFTGLEALQIVRNINKDIPFIMISGALGEERAADIMLQGASDFVLKNNLERLIPAVKRELKNFSEKKKSKDLVQKTQKKLDKASEIGNLGYWEWDLEKDKLWWSQTISSIFEIDHISEQNFESFIGLFENSTSGEEVTEFIEFVTKTQKPTDLELKIYTKNNHEKWIRIDVEPIIVNDDVKQLFGSIKEITLIRESEQKLSNLANNLPGAVLQYKLHSDGSDSIEYLSDGCVDLWGIQPEEALKNSSAIWGLVHDDDIDSLSESVKTSANTLQNWEAKWRINHPSGEIRWHEGRGTPRRLPDGSTVWDTIITDVTEKAKLNQDLEFSEQRFKSIIKEGTDPIAIIDKSGICTYQLSLDSAIQELGLPDNYYVGKNFFDYIHEEDREYFIQELKTLALGERKEIGPYRFKYPDETWHWLETTVTNLMHNPTIQGTVATSRDVTERKENEEEISKLSMVASKTTDTIIITDSNDRITWVNDAFEQLTGFDKEESIGREVGSLLRGKETDKGTVKRIDNAKAHKKSFRDVILNYNKNGDKFWVSITGDPMYDYKGEFKGFIAIQRDVTESRIHERKLKKTLREKDVLLSEVHHRVKNNLAVISGLMQLQSFTEEDMEMQIKLNKNVIRIQTMAMTHEMLYQSDSFSNTYLDKEYFERIVKTIHQDYEKKANLQFSLDIDPFSLNINQALPFSMVFSEVVSKICSYCLRKNNRSSFSLEISDGDDLKFKVINKNEKTFIDLWEEESNANKFDLNLIEIFCSQLNGRFSIEQAQKNVLFDLVFTKKETRGSVSNIIA